MADSLKYFVKRKRRKKNFSFSRVDRWWAYYQSATTMRNFVIFVFIYLLDAVKTLFSCYLIKVGINYLTYLKWVDLWRRYCNIGIQTQPLVDWKTFRTIRHSLSLFILKLLFDNNFHNLLAELFSDLFIRIFPL